MKKTLFSIVSFLFLSFSATTAHAQVTSGAKYPGPQQPNFLSCENACGGASPVLGICWCDETCEKYGDCCEDYSKYCAPKPKVCGGVAGIACAQGEYCKITDSKQCGPDVKDAAGECTPKPTACPDVYDPVCGCDGKTYSNDCDAAAEGGTAVQYKGACKVEPGTICFDDKQCGKGQGCDLSVCLSPCGPGAVVCEAVCAGACRERCGGKSGKASCGEGQFCNYTATGAAACGANDASGFCQDIPTQGCTKEYAPVCGCDGKTYGNACMAYAAGVSVASEGECKKEPPNKVCGGLQGLKCGKGEFCNYPVKAMCGAADATGTCQVIPEICTEHYDPVCGCDGKTYGNACKAGAAGVSVASKGECKASGSSCGGQCDGQSPVDSCWCDSHCAKMGDCCDDYKATCEPKEPRACGARLGNTCAKNEYCSFTLKDICGWADATGICQPRPEACTQIYAPVCGCNGVTYSNRCTANAAGQSIQSLDACAK